ncbi:hypothetical protein [Clostridium weizhouense]|uniref:Uncharacterized protein n=1 Tax=Clostridium weizhouense TaxID=2859781 RepID=A0ABS7ARP3_9CLOT|nr:hypothetical protein [Clostridium weizhouense]MBW6411337.1 hypothetical protein [Clostridium weizhouense]
MALKKLTEAQKLRIANMKQGEVTQTMSTSNNSITNASIVSREEVIPKVENVLEDVIEDTKYQSMQKNIIPQNIFVTNISNKEGQARTNYDYSQDDESEDDFFQEEEANNDDIDGINSLQDLLVEITTRKAKIPEGEIKFLIKHISLERCVESRYGIANQVTVHYHLHKEINGEIKEFSLKQKYYVSNYPKSRFGKLYKALTGKETSNHINLRKLYGISGTAEITYYTADNDDVFENVDIESIRVIRKHA